MAFYTPIDKTSNVQERVITSQKDREKNIEDPLKAIESLSSISGTDVSPVRLMMDDLLKVWHAQWYQEAANLYDYEGHLRAFTGRVCSKAPIEVTKWHHCTRSRAAVGRALVVDCRGHFR